MNSKELMPILFIGHGSPLNALEKNEYSKSWARLAEELPRPKVILCISAHWLTEGTAVTAMLNPKTIHDFYGFPRELYQVRYPAKGSPNYAAVIQELIKTVQVNSDYEWGFDHGTWSVLMHMYPEAEIPVLQMSLDYNLAFEKQYQVGRELRQLRTEGVLIIGSGNLVHNLMAMDTEANPYLWAIDFDSFVKKSLVKGDHRSLLNYTNHKNFALAHPTYDHYLPLLYVLGAVIENEKPQFFNEKIFAGAVSMRCVVFGNK